MPMNIANTDYDFTNVSGKPDLTIPIEGGDMKVYISQEVESKGTDPYYGGYKVEVVYSGERVSYISNSDYSTSKVKGNPSLLLNNLIQELFIQGKIISKK